jgi:hypothetical protein
MVNLTSSDPKELKKKMDNLLANSRLTEEDTIKIGREIKRGIAKRLGI